MMLKKENMWEWVRADDDDKKEQEKKKKKKNGKSMPKESPISQSLCPTKKKAVNNSGFFLPP